MQEIIIALVAAGASLLTFFSGFGLGTLLTPVFVIFFPVETAVVMTGIVHLLNNIFKLTLIGRHAVKSVFLRFGIPAIAGAFLGANGLVMLADINWQYTWMLLGIPCLITPVKLVIAALMFAFALAEFMPVSKKSQFRTAHLVPGGLLSGFFGGLSGHQGALRSVFLIHCGLSKEAFIATGIVIACLVDMSRIPVYLAGASPESIWENTTPLLIAVAAAFTGAYAGRRLLQKVTVSHVRSTVGVMIGLLSIGLGAGVL